LAYKTYTVPRGLNMFLPVSESCVSENVIAYYVGWVGKSLLYLQL